jgi:hypothetical protein
LEGGPPRFMRDFSCPTLLRNISDRFSISHTGVSPSTPGLPRPFCYRLPYRYESPTTPSYRSRSVWAIPRSLATTRGVSVDFLSYRYLDGSVPCVGSFVTGHDSSRVTPFGNLGIIACLPASPSLSQAPTSFIASLRLGIHRTLL